MTNWSCTACCSFLQVRLVTVLNLTSDCRETSSTVKRWAWLVPLSETLMGSQFLPLGDNETGGWSTFAAASMNYGPLFMILTSSVTNFSFHDLASAAIVAINPVLTMALSNNLFISYGEVTTLCIVRITSLSNATNRWWSMSFRFAISALRIKTPAASSTYTGIPYSVEFEELRTRFEHD